MVEPLWMAASTKLVCRKITIFSSILWITFIRQYFWILYPEHSFSKRKLLMIKQMQCPQLASSKTNNKVLTAEKLNFLSLSRDKNYNYFCSISFLFLLLAYSLAMLKYSLASQDRTKLRLRLKTNLRYEMHK